MAGKIKGIVIELGADVQPLNKALADVNKKSKDLQSELRQVDKLLKLNPKDTEMLAQKQKLLAEAVANSKEKLDRLKTAQEQVNEQFRKGEISEEQYRAFQREVAKTEQELKGFERQLNETAKATDTWKDKLDKAQTSLKNVGAKMTDMGKTLSMSVTAPIVAVGAASFKMAADLQDAMGATDQIFNKASDSVKKWADGLDSYYGIAEGEALEYANMMGSMLKNIGGLTEEEAAKQAQTLIELAGDLTAMYGGTTADAVRALTGALKGNNTMLDNYGMAVNDAMIKTKALEMGLYDGTGQMDLATKQAATLALIMEQTGAAQGQAAREAEGASGGMRAFATEIKNLSTDIGEVLLPVITPLLANLNDLVKKFGDLSPEMKKAIVIVAGLAAAIGPLLIVLGMMASGLGAIVGILPVLGTALTVLTGPVGIAVAAIGALTVGGIALYKHLQKDAIPAVELFGKETSKATQEAVGAYMELDEKAGQSLMNLKLTGETVTKEMADSLTGTFAQMAETITAGMEKDFAESTASMQDYLAISNTLSQEEESQILANMQNGYERRKQAVADGEAQIKEILSTASQEKRSLTQAELTEIGTIQQQMKEQAVQALSETELESKAILERMRQQADELTAQQAADVAKNSTEQKNKAIKAAEEQYNNVIKEIIRQRDEAGTISKEQADKLIAEATRQKDEAIKKAEEMHKGVIDEAKKLAGEHIDLVDWQTGEIKSKFEVLREKLGLEGNNIYLLLLGPAGHVVLSAKHTVQQFEEMKQKAIEKFLQLKDGALRKVEELKTGLDNIIQRIKDAFANLRIEIPRPKLPHISVNWKSVGVGDARVSIPDFDLNWYKSGGIFDRPSIIGVGEAGTEAVIPLEKMPGLISDALREAMGGRQTATAGVIVQNMYVRNDNDIKLVARELYNLQQTNARGRGLR